MVGITGYSPEAETDKAETQDNGGNANTGGNGGDGDGLNNLGFADWSLPPTLLSLLRMQGEPNDGFFLDFIRRALQQNVDEDNIIKACLHGQSPYDGSIYKHVRNCGGEDFVKRVIASIVSELPEQTE